MKNIGIICEYNPFHLGHRKQINAIRQKFGPDCHIICLMSGNFVQRGAPAIFDKTLRAQSAVMCGADLVLELPVTGALSSAEGFANTGVTILSSLCDTLCFGCETASYDLLWDTAKQLLSDDFPPVLRKHLETGISFPAARAAALAEFGGCDALLKNPNDILAVEYCKAILQQNLTMDIFPIFRGGHYHDTAKDTDNPSATAVRNFLHNGQDWQCCVPLSLCQLYAGADLHTLAAGERAVLYRLRTMSDDEFEALPYGSEGLWRKLMHESRRCATLEEILENTKSKRYTRSRLDRMVMCAYLGITKSLLSTPAPYVRILAFSDQGTQIIKSAKDCISLLHTGQKAESPYQQLENRWDDLYTLFRQDSPDSAGKTVSRRVYIQK